MRLILTRPKRESHQLAAKLNALGHQPVICPLLEIIPRTDVGIPEHPYQAIIATSANAFIQPESLKPLHHLPVYAVGPHSLAAAQLSGFHQAQAHGGTVETLCDYLKTILSPHNGPLLYLTGAEISRDLKALLEGAGFTVERCVLYDALPLHPANLASELLKADAVLLYSPRTTKLWCAEVNRLNAQSEAARLIYYCLSPAIAEILPKGWHFKIATSPQQGAMLSLLEYGP